MKTNRNFFSKIYRASLIIALAFATLVPVSCQNAAHQPFSYKTDFIKQMIYQVSNEFFTRSSVHASLNRNMNQDAEVVLINYTVAEKKANCCTSEENNQLADFLTQAAQLNTPVANDVVETDATLDFLTEAAQLNAPVAEMESEQDNTLEFLTAAAQLNTSVAQDENAKDDTLDFLINAAQLDTPVANEEASQDNLLDFLTQSAHLNDRVAE